MSQAALENFIKKYRLAMSNKSKDLRITIEEATDIVSAIAQLQINSNLAENLSDSLKKVEKRLQAIEDSRSMIFGSVGKNMDGGGF